MRTESLGPFHFVPNPKGHSLVTLLIVVMNQGACNLPVQEGSKLGVEEPSLTNPAFWVEQIRGMIIGNRKANAEKNKQRPYSSNMIRHQDSLFICLQSFLQL